MVGSHLLDSGRAKAHEILNQSNKQNGEKDEKNLSEFSDENSSPVANNDDKNIGIPTRSFYSTPQSSRGVQLVTMSQSMSQFKKNMFGPNSPEVRTYSRNKPISKPSYWESMRGRPEGPVSSTRVPDVLKDSPRNVLGSLAKFPTSNVSHSSDDQQKSSPYAYGKTPTRKPQSSLLGNRSYPSPSSEKDKSRKILGSISNHHSTELVPEDCTFNLFKLPSTIVQSYEIGFPNQGT